MAYTFYLDKVALPVTPSKLNIKIKNQNDTVNLINEGEINILKAAGLTEIEFEALIPAVKYPFAGKFKPIASYLTKFENLKNSKKPFRFIVSRVTPAGKLIFDTNILVGLEDYEITEDAKNGLDLMVKIKLKQYRVYGTKTIKVQKPKGSQTKSTASTTTARPGSPSSKNTYTVKKGDCLWNIAKKYLGDGSRYTEIYKLNKDKISNPNLIYPGQVLKMPNK